MTTASGQKRRGKDALPPLEPKFTNSPVFPPKMPPLIPPPPLQPATAAELGLVDAARGRGGATEHLLGKL